MDDVSRRLELLRTLTPQQVRVAHLLCQNLTWREIAAEMVLSYSAIRYHVGNIYEKLGIDATQRTARQRQMAFFCVALQLIESEDHSSEVPPEPPPGQPALRALAAAEEDNKELEKERRAQERARRMPVPVPPNAIANSPEAIPVPIPIPPPARERWLMWGALASAGILALLVVGLLLRGPDRVTIVREIQNAPPTQAAVALVLTPTPTKAPPTPQVVTQTTYTLNSQALPCLQRPDPTASVVAQLAAGTVEQTDQILRTPSGDTWYHSNDQQCWLRAQSGVLQTFAALADAEEAAAKYAPPGTVLYQSDWSNGTNDWTAGRGWKVVNGALVNDGSDSSHASWITAPYHLGDVSDYAVEAQIQFVRWTYVYDADYGVAARVQKDSGYSVGRYTGGVDHSSSQIWRVTGGGFNELGQAPDLVKGAPVTNVYRIEVRGNQIRFLLDGQQVLTQTDNSYFEGGQIAIWALNTQVTVYSVKIIKL